MEEKEKRGVSWQSSLEALAVGIVVTAWAAASLFFECLWEIGLAFFRALAICARVAIDLGHFLVALIPGVGCKGASEEVQEARKRGVAKYSGNAGAKT
ncbi:MAG: hypothetical protein P4L62_00665 [Candidatus Pacebacteria bacterium]|nr:hypothetical protein [Candidatus Paceibacterota bacterium]MDR3582861.1 hypothetical protein [Candidatus Paceibacterota bacterium]